ncbi:MAG: hypothetical protein RMI35_11470, partial [Leptospiraceae bacterium]|nr:hypothetical protein [Leptospiraceae bacterium]
MRNQVEFLAKELHVVCVNLSPMHFLYLQYLAQSKFQGDFARTVESLLKRNLGKIYPKSISHIKRTLTAKYQPRTKKYQRFWISVSPVMWGRLFQLRLYMGYSVSYLIRILLELEMMGETTRNRHTEIPRSSTTDHLLYHNYEDRIMVDCLTGSVVFDFYDGVVA